MPLITHLIQMVLTVIKFLLPSLLLAVIQTVLELFSNDSILEITKIWVKDHEWGSFSEILSKFYQVNQYESKLWNEKLILQVTKHQGYKMMVEMNFFFRLLHMRLIQLIQLIFLLMTLLPMKNAMKMKQKKK